MGSELVVEDVGSRVRTVRLEKNLTQEDVAYRARIEQTVLSKIERGVQRPGPAIARRIALALGLEETAFVRPR